MGCASSIAPQHVGHPASIPGFSHGDGSGGSVWRPKPKLNSLVPEPPTTRANAVAKPAQAPSATAVSVASTACLTPPSLSYEELCVAFLKAVKCGDVSAMETLAQRAVRLTPTPQSLVNIRGMWESTPLVYAAQYGHAEAAQWLLARGANVLAQNEKGATALLLASLEGMKDVCERILGVAAIMGPAVDNGSQSGDKTNCAGLVAPREPDQQVGIVYNPASDTTARLSPLLAASMNGHAAVAALLLAHGADPNQFVTPATIGGVAGGRQCALLLAARYGHATVLELLLRHNANPAVRDTGTDNHALLLACENKHEDASLLLLRHAATAVEPTEDDGACGKPGQRCVWLQPNRHGVTALHAAAASGFVSVAATVVVLARGLLQDKSATFLDAVTASRGETALLMACRKRHFDIARGLLEAGADPHRADRGGTSAADVLARGDKHELLGLCRPPLTQGNGAEGNAAQTMTGVVSAQLEDATQTVTDSTMTNQPVDGAINCQSSVAEASKSQTATTEHSVPCTETGDVAATTSQPKESVDNPHLKTKTETSTGATPVVLPPTDAITPPRLNPNMKSPSTTGISPLSIDELNGQQEGGEFGYFNPGERVRLDDEVSSTTSSPRKDKKHRSGTHKKKKRKDADKDRSRGSHRHKESHTTSGSKSDLPITTPDDNADRSSEQRIESSGLDIRQSPSL